MSQKRITIDAELSRTGDGSYDTFFEFQRAYNQDGESAGKVQGGFYRDFPPNLKIKQKFYITETDNTVTLLTLAGLRIRNVIVEIRNLPVKWD